MFADGEKVEQIAGVIRARASGSVNVGCAFAVDQARGELAADLDPRLGLATPAWSCPLLRLRSALGELPAYLRANASSLVGYAQRYLRASASPRP